MEDHDPGRDSREIGGELPGEQAAQELRGDELPGTQWGVPGREPAGWRTRPGGVDPALVRMLKGAGAIALLGVVLVGGWSMLGRRHQDVPLIEAPAGPLRVRPDNPGGMQLANGVETAAEGAEQLAPPPEVPQPQALRAQIEAAGGAGGPAVGAAPGAGPGGVPAGAAADGAHGQDQDVSGGAMPLTDGPGTGEAGQEPAPAARAEAGAGRTPRVAVRPEGVGAAASAAARAGGAAVQLAAMESEQAARVEWQRLQRAMPDLLGGRSAEVRRADVDGRAVWRVRTGGFADMAQAAEFCVRVRAKGAGCSIAAF